MQINNNNNDKLFFLIWRNLIIRNKIFKEIQYFNNFMDRDFKIYKEKGYNDWLNYPYKDRIERIYLFIGGGSRCGVTLSKNLERVFEIMKSLPENVKSIHVELTSHTYEYPLTIDNKFMSDSITSLKFSGPFKLFFKNSKTSLTSKNLKSLEFFNSFQQKLKVDGGVSIFENSGLKYLNLGTFSGSFNEQIPIGSLPNSIETLILPYMFNQFIDEKAYPKSLTRLIFNEHFNSSLSPLPTGLKYLKFGRDYNMPIGQNVLPSSLEELIFGVDFNKPLPYAKLLPTGLKYLFLGHSFNQELLKSTLPISLTSLEFDTNCTLKRRFEINHLINLKSLTLPRGDYIGTPILPENLEHLQFGTTFTNIEKVLKSMIPLKKLKSLDLTSIQNNNKSISFNDQIPSSICKLRILNIKNSISKIGLSKLINLNSIYTNSFILNNTNTMGCSNSNLEFECSYDFLNLEICKNDVPLNLTTLNFGDAKGVYINHGSLIDCINLTDLNLGSNYNHPIGRNIKGNDKLFFPKNLIHLTIGHSFNSSFNCSILPSTLKSLRFENYYNDNNNITLIGLPSSLILLKFSLQNIIISNDLLNYCSNLKHLLLHTKNTNFSNDFNCPSNLTIYTVHDNYSVVYNFDLFNSLLPNLNLMYYNQFNKKFNILKNDL